MSPPLTVLPAPRTPDPLDAPVLRWGVMGTGWIAQRFINAVRRSTSQRFCAIASRNADRAAESAHRLEVPTAHQGYDALAADPQVDVVYVATGHGDHLECALTAITAGKHVLIEKPLALDEAQGLRIAQAASAAGVFCAEALWSFYLPRFDVVRQLLDDGALGEIHTVLADHGEHFPANHRIFDPRQHGGPLYDLGTYPFSFATWVLGKTQVLAATATPHPSGVDGQVAALLADGHGRQAVLHTTLLGDTPTTASIIGSAATLVLPGPFYQPGDVVLTGAGAGAGAAARYREAAIGHEGLFWQAAEVARCIGENRPQTPLRPLADSLATLSTLDAVRAIGQV